MDGNRNLSLNCESEIGQDAFHGWTIDRFGKAEAELPMDLIESAEAQIGELLVEERRPFGVLLFFPRHSALSANSAAT
jgi:hypothetical protein